MLITNGTRLRLKKNANEGKYGVAYLVNTFAAQDRNVPDFVFRKRCRHSKKYKWDYDTSHHTRILVHEYVPKNFKREPHWYVTSFLVDSSCFEVVYENSKMKLDLMLQSKGIV